MAAEQVAAVIKRALTDAQSLEQITSNLNAIPGAEDLDEKEKSIVLLTLQGALDIDRIFLQRKMRERLQHESARAEDLGRYTVQILKDTLDSAKKTYVLINTMNTVMFWLGVTLFVSSALLGAFMSDKRAATLLGGLGITTFVAIFIVGPIKRSQHALSNLVQAEISFMNFFDQITYWSNYALSSDGAIPPPILERVEKASDVLQQRSRETINLLQDFVEKEGSRKTR